MAVRGVLFDLDGTLVDRAATLVVFAHVLANTFAEDLNEMTVDGFVRLVQGADGKGYREKDAVFEQLRVQLPWRRVPEVEELSDFWFTTFPKCAQPMAGVYEVLEALQRQEMKMGIVTNGRVRSQQGKIERLDLGAYVETVVISEDLGIKKPDRRIFETALQDLNLSASEVWFVGDHPDNDVAGAEAVGMTGVWLSGHLPWPERRALPVRQADCLSDLLVLLQAEVAV